MGQIQWSPEVGLDQKQILFWKKLLESIRKKKYNNKLLRRMAEKAALAETEFKSYSEQTVKDRLQAVWKQYRSKKKLAQQLRRSHVDRLAKAIAEQQLQAKDKSFNRKDKSHEVQLMILERKEKVLKQIKVHEQQRIDARRIKAIRGDTRRSGLTMVDVPQADGTWKTVTDKVGIEKACLEENEARFNQARNTPFMVPPLYDDIGPFGTGPRAQEILDGTYQVPEGTDPYAAEFISYLKTPPGIAELGPIDLRQTAEQHAQGWMKMRESTSSGISGLHFGHFRAHLEDPGLAEIDRILAALPFETGYSPTRWSSGIDVMMEKKKGIFRTTKLRTILLYEAEFNHGNKGMGREVARQAEIASAFAPENYGSRKGFQAIEQCLNKELVFDILRQTRRSAVLVSNDAKSCYDRIVHSVAALSMQRLGLPEQATTCMFGCIQNLHHYVRTAFGVSEASFGGPREEHEIPVQGVGQGNGGGPIIWAGVSTPILDMVRANNRGLYFTSPIALEGFQLIGFSFVDDNDLLEGGKGTENYSTEELIARSQTTLNLYEGGLRATGGALEPSKSFWYLIEFDPDSDKPAYLPATDDQSPLTVLDAQGIRQTLQRLAPDQSERTLGVRISPTGDRTKQFEYMLSQATSWADHIRSGGLPRPLVEQALRTTILKTLEYPLPVTSLNREECDKIMSKLFMSALPRMGMSRNFPRTILFGPRSRGGKEFPHLFTTQGSAHLAQILRHFGSESITGSLLRTEYEEHLLEIGSGTPMFQLPYDKWEFLVTKSWLKATWQFCSESQIQCLIPHPHIPCTRNSSQFLMDVVRHQQQRLSNSQMSAINRCRIYLQVLTTADICTVNGGKLLPGMWDGIRVRRNSPFKWRPTKRPKNADWHYWQQALTKCFRIRHINRNNVAMQLGEWIPRPTGNSRLYPAWSITPDYKWLLYVLDSKWVKHKRTKSRANRYRVATYTRQQQAMTQKDIDSICQSVVPVSVEIGDNGIDVLEVSRDRVPVSTPPPTPPNWEARTQNLDPQATWAVEVSKFPSDGGRELAEELKQGTLRGISDGSFKDEHGTASFRLVGGDTTSMYGDHTTPGHPQDQSAFRSELSGIYGQVLLTYTLAQQFKVTHGKVTVGCDGESALYQCFLKSQDLNASERHYDLVNAIRSLIRKCPFDIVPHHVKGHQDDDPNAELDEWARLNIEMDQRAKEHWERTHNTPLHDRIQLIFGEPTPIFLSGYKLVSHLAANIREHIHGPPLEEKWSKEQLTDPDFPVDWKPRTIAMRAGSTTRATWIAKHSIGVCGVQATLHKWGKQESPLCPLCQSEPETASHVLQCMHTGMQTHWTVLLEELATWLAKTTHNSMKTTILAAVRTWLGHATDALNPADRILREAIQEQSRHGWYSFFMGFLSPRWQESQQQYYRRKGSKHSSKRWTAALISRLWNTAWDMWKARSKLVHDNDEGRYAKDLNTRIDRLLTLSPRDFPRSKRRLFTKYNSKQQLLKKPIAQREAWVLTLEAFEGQLSDTEHQLARQRRLMSRWMNLSISTDPS